MDSMHAHAHIRLTARRTEAKWRRHASKERSQAVSTGRMPSSSHCAKGGGSTTFASDLYPVIGDGRVPQAPYLGTRRCTPTSHTVPPLVHPVHMLCPAHNK